MLCEGNGSHRSPAGMKTLRDSYMHPYALCCNSCSSGVREQPWGGEREREEEQENEREREREREMR